MQGAFESVKGRPFFVRRWGDPSLPRLLLLHGFPEYGGAWHDVAKSLNQRFHCIAPDQRGFGQSWTPEGVEAYGASHLIDDMVALIGTDAMTGPISVFGHDWGAAIAYGLAMFHPGLVDRLIIANGVHPVPFQRALAAGGAQTTASQYITWLRQPGVEDDLSANGFEKLQQLFATHMDMSWLSGTRLQDYKVEWSRPGRLRAMLNWYRASPLVVATPGQPIAIPPLPLTRLKVPQPHLLLWGDGDTALLPETTQGLEEFAPDLTRITLPGCDHWLHHQKPEEVAQAILDWHP
ncbi:hydrolase, alpha/beta fold family protein [Roseobacter sp. MED193]|uniref:alpha/beta fold hydrolase n=1 Tax=Roseobacter sp. MED193 TaxID=314262 RepID=UPI000068EE8E|nr:alpha/beta hydrolase [Roseobacter sp. MED193]EAQ45956.1 hydrolase, alpha/beta fold family protein [Roseobacter sp. MED193]